MESVIYEDSPLAEYLEGAGKAELDSDDVEPSDGSAHAYDGSKSNSDFAPRGLPGSGQSFHGVLPPPIKNKAWKDGGVAGLLDAFARAVKAKPSTAENSKFIERFRYILAASQLLDENTSQATWRTAPSAGTKFASSAIDQDAIRPNGAIAAGIAALALVWLVYWSRWNLRANSLTKKKVVIIILMVAVVAVAFYTYARRQLLQYLRRQALTWSSILVVNLQSFDASTSHAIQHIQEVELVSRGYRLSSPLPPISRIEQSSSSKRCMRLRKALQRAHSRTLPSLSDACRQLEKMLNEDDLERYLDVYDINDDDVKEAATGWCEDEFDEQDSIRAIRVHQFRFTTLRRLFLCSLISLQADGTGADYLRWRVAGDAMRRLAEIAGERAENINNILNEDEPLELQSPTSPTNTVVHNPLSSANSASAGTSTPTRERLRKQFRSLATLSTGIRSIQAKMQVLREDSQSILANRSNGPRSSDQVEDEINDSDLQLAELGNSLLAHYDAIGTDLKSLVQAWESGRTGLSLSLDRAERRLSRASAVSSLGPRSPALSLGGLTAVDEMLVGGTPMDALAALEGTSLNGSDRGPADLRAFPSPRLRISTSTDMSDSITDSASISGSGPGSGVEEVYEGMAAPRPPKSLGTPQERAQRLVEERKRRESRQVGAQMIRELESVLSGGRMATDIGQRVSRRSSGLCSPVRGNFLMRSSSREGDRRTGNRSSSSGLQRSNSNTQGEVASGRRRPFSMYNIGQQLARPRVTSL